MKEINISELKEISINNAPANIFNRAKRIIEKKYNVDLIDNYKKWKNNISENNV
jgi:hypothetical protein